MFVVLAALIVRPVAFKYRSKRDDPRWRAQLERLSSRVYGWTGNHVGLSELSAADVRRLRRERPPVVEELRRDSITLAGRASTEILGATK